MEHKYFSLVLHSHIPYVIAHGTWPHGMDWLYEAAAETYIPLLDVLYRLADEGHSPQINIGFTPVLMDQLKNRQFVQGFDIYLNMKIETAQENRRFFEKTGRREFAALAVYWEDWYEQLRLRFYDKYHTDILEAFRYLQDEGHIEILTSGASHGYFPLLSKDESIAAQIRQGAFVYRRFMGRDPRGFWIPECAYRPAYIWKPPLGEGEAYPRRGVDEILKSQGLEYFFVDTHLLKGGEAKGVYADRFPALKHLWEKFKEQYTPAETAPQTPYLPYLAYPSDMAFFVRDDISGAQVWSRHMGYPGDGWYLEFHKKHFPGGMRYWRITSSRADLGDKAVYDVQKTRDRLEEHAAHFVGLLNEILAQRPNGLIVALYDTELLGHWWFEGPEWLYSVLKKLARSPVRPLTAGRSLEQIPPQTIISLPEGSWGKGGFHWIWLNKDTSWIWEKIYRIEEDAAELDIAALRQNDRKTRLLKQFLREKFLLESSDWPFLISTWSARDYGERRATEHFERAETLMKWIRRREELSPEDERWLATWEEEDGLFEEIVTADGSHL
jgi:1,4-alpha-glucan branching enzyme